VSLGADNTVTFPLTGSWVPYSAFDVDSGITRAVWNQELATETLTATLIDEAGGITVPLAQIKTQLGTDGTFGLYCNLAYLG